MENKTLKSFPDLLEQGIIVIDSQGIIHLYNKKSAEFFGVYPFHQPGHPKGKVEKGDIVIISNNSLGCDDGGLRPGDLKKIGIDPGNLKTGDMFVAIGIAGAEPGKGIIKNESCKSNKNLELIQKFKNIRLRSSVNKKEHLNRIQVGKDTFDFIFYRCASHMVVLSPQNGKIKFYQTRGYTGRKEETKALLDGLPFMGKGSFAPKNKPFKKHINDFHKDSSLIRVLLETAEGVHRGESNIEGEINNLPVNCSIKPLTEGGKIVGAVLQVWDVKKPREVEGELDFARHPFNEIEEKTKKEKNNEDPFKNIISYSPQMKEVKNSVLRASETDSTVLILGESGTGKTLIAKALHEASPRKNGPFVQVECASIPETLLESELFGYEEGAFTGAANQGKQGRFEIAQGGTLFLDEIGELPFFLQAKLLQVLQEKTFFRLGGLEPVKLDARVVTATNKDLEKEIEEGNFREDLFYRINIIPIFLPPLRERLEDIFPLVNFLVGKICKELNMPVKKISRKAMQSLLYHHWNGNIRELENALERAINMTPGSNIHPENLPEEIYNPQGNSIEGITGDDNCIQIQKLTSLNNLVEEVEKKAIQEALAKTGGSRNQAMELLKIGKTAFYKKLKKYGIN